MKAFLLSLACAGLLISAGPVTAQTTPARAAEAEADSTRTYRLQGVTVTTTRSAVARDRIPQRIEVIDAEQATRSGASTIDDALRSNVAVDVIAFPGLLAGFSLRGFRPQYSGGSPRTLVLVDGHPAGTNNLALLHSAAVERVEVLRGPASALYGPNAMGGILNIVTRRSTGPLSGRIAAGYGSFGAYQGDLTAGGRLSQALDFDLSLSTTGQHDGYRVGSGRDAATDSLTKTLADGGTVRLPWTTADSVIDFSRYRSRSASARLGVDLGGAWRFDLRASDYRADDVENPGDLAVTDWDSRSLKDVGRRSLDATLRGTLGDHQASLRLYGTDERIDYYSGPVAPNFVNFRTPTRTLGLQLQDAVDLGPAGAVLGIDYTIADARSERFDADGGRLAPFNPDSRIASGGAFAQVSADLFQDRLTTVAGLRYDLIGFEIRDTPHLLGYPANSERTGVFTPSGGIRYRPTDWLHLFGNAGRAYVTPDPFFVAGYSESRAGEGRQAVVVARGNPGLEPETSTSWDAGVAVAKADLGLDIELAYFHTDVRDRVASLMVPTSGDELTVGGDTILSITSYTNVDRAEIRGLEAALSFDVARLLERGFSLRLFLNGTRFLRAVERPAEAGPTRRIPNVATSTVVAGLEWDDLRRFSARLSGRYVGERVDSDYVAWWEPGEILYPSYLVMDAHLGARIGGRYRVSVDVRNLGDADYFEVRGYNMPGRAVKVGVGVEW